MLGINIFTSRLYKRVHKRLRRRGVSLKQVGLVILLIAGECAIIFDLVYGYSVFAKNRNNTIVLHFAAHQQVYSAAMLSSYTGVDPSKPILLGLDGYVFDVTKGKQYYAPGEPYHYLAGKDSSAALDLFGGDIIKQKYPVVGTLKK